MGRHYDRGIMLYGLRRFREAVDAFGNEVREQPQSASAYAMRAVCLLNVNDIASAFLDVREALRIDPELDFAFYVLSCISSARGGTLAAESAAREAIRLAPCANYYCRLAEVLFYDNRFEESLIAVDQGLALEPENITCLISRAHALRALCRLPEARESLRSALAQNPEDPSALQTFGKLQLDIGNTDDATDVLREARRLNPVLHYDRDVLAAAYGRIVWPFSILDRYLIRFDTWSPSRRWIALAFASTLLLMCAVAMRSYPFVMLPLYFVVFNSFVTPITMNEIAIPIGMAAFRKDLDAGWYQVTPQIIRVIFALIVHGIASAAAISAAFWPPFAVMSLGIITNWDMVLTVFRRFQNGSGAAFALGLIGLNAVACLVFVASAVFDGPNHQTLYICWLMMLPISYFLRIHLR